MKTKNVLMVAIMLLVIGIISCKKPEKGDPGPQGKLGNANVANYSLTVYPYNWVYDNLYKRWYYRYYTSINMQSAVIGYVMSGSGQQAIPYFESSTGYQYDMATYLFGSPSYIEFQYTNLNSTTTAPAYDKYFYIVAIPPAIKAANPDMDYTNYNEVKAVFNLKD